MPRKNAVPSKHLLHLFHCNIVPLERLKHIPSNSLAWVRLLLGICFSCLSQSVVKKLTKVTNERTSERWGCAGSRLVGSARPKSVLIRKSDTTGQSTLTKCLQHPYSHSSHVTAPYKLSFFYYNFVSTLRVITLSVVII